MNKVYLVENHKQILFKSHDSEDVLFRYSCYIAKKKKLYMVFKGNGWSTTIDGRFN